MRDGILFECVWFFGRKISTMRMWRSLLKQKNRQLSSKENLLIRWLWERILWENLFVLIMNHCYAFVLEFRRILSLKFQEISIRERLELQRKANSSFLIKPKLSWFLVNLNTTRVKGSIRLSATNLQNFSEKFTVVEEKFHLEVQAWRCFWRPISF